MQKYLLNEKLLYIVLNIVISAIGFIRSFIFMKSLFLYDLGILTVIQTSVMFIGMFQLGLFNGGLRIFSLNVLEQNKKINNLIFSYLFALFVFLIFIWVVLVLFKLNVKISSSFVLISIIVGICSLAVNWLTNALIGKQFISELNRINFFSGIVAILSLPIIYYFGFKGAIFALFSQPFTFIIIAVYRNIDLRPTTFFFDVSLTKYILGFGFIPFLSGIFSIINMLIERWCILAKLGAESLGSFYLVFIYTTLFAIIPSSINSLFFPKAMLYYNDNSYSALKKLVANYYLLLFLYCLLIVIITFVFLRVFIHSFLPVHEYGVNLVFLVLPGLVILTLSDPIGLLFNASVKLKIILNACITSTLVNILGMYLVLSFDIVTLKNIVHLRNITNVSYMFIYIIGYIMVKRDIWRKVVYKSL